MAALRAVVAALALASCARPASERVPAASEGAAPRNGSARSASPPLVEVAPSASAIALRPTCPADMVLAGSACIDRYEAPNERGKKPLLMQSVGDAEMFCEAREKRLCTEDEWVRACAGPH